MKQFEVRFKAEVESGVRSPVMYRVRYVSRLPSDVGGM